MYNMKFGQKIHLFNLTLIEFFEIKKQTVEV